MKILTIGGTGVLSAAVVNCCISHGMNVTIIHRGNKKQFVNPQASEILCDISDEKQIAEKLKGLQFDAVIDFLVVNPFQLWRSLSLFGGLAKQYVFISTAQVYNTSKSKIFSENDETPQPLWQYSINKAECERLLEEYSISHDLAYTIIRPGVTYDNRRIPYGIVPPYGKHWTIIARISTGKPIITWNNGENQLNLTRVEDFAEGVVGLLGNKKAYNEAFNIVGDYTYSWKEVLQTIGKIIDSPVNTIDFPVEKFANALSPDNRERLLGGRANDLICSNQKLKSVVPYFHSTLSLEDGLKRTVDAYRSNNYYDGIDYKWDAEQDRILKKLSPNGYKGKYVSYLQQNFIDNFQNLCVWKMEYYADNKQMKFCWKIIRKFIYSPLRRLF